MKSFNSNVVQFTIGGVHILGNKANGSFCGLSKEGKQIVDKIYSGESLSFSERTANYQLLNFLKKSGFFENNHNELSLQAAYLHITNRCNLQCVGCYSEDASRNAQADLSLQDVQSLIAKLKEAGVNIIVISGGEPLLRSDLAKILKYARECVGIQHIILLTNGLLLSDAIAESISMYVSEISISVDAFDEKCCSHIRRENRFNDLMRAVDISKRYFSKVSILPTLHKLNIEHIEKYLCLAKEKGVDISFSILTCSPDSEAGSLIPAWEQLNWLGSQFVPGETLTPIDIDVENFAINICDKCGMGSEMVSVASDGTVYPCHMCHTEELGIGNLLSDSMNMVLEKRNALLSPISVDKIPECCECSYKYICGGGCRARAYLSTRSLLRKDPYCQMFKAYAQLFEEAILKQYDQNQ